MTTATTTAAPAASGKLDPQIVKVALAIMAGGIAVIFDATIVSVALRNLGRDLGASLATIQWVTTGYLLAMFAAIPAVGWLQARLGGKRLWLASLALFTFGSVLCACAWNAQSLIAFRIVQGLGGGIMMPLMVTLIMQAAHGQPLGQLLAVVGLPASLGPVLGPPIGGTILNFLSWRWLFLVNVPLAVMGAIAAIRVLPDDRPAVGVRPRFDKVGFALLSPGIVLAIYGMSNITKDGGVSRTDFWLPIAVGVALVAAFIAWAYPRDDRALLDIKLLKSGPLALSSMLLMLTGIALYGSMLLLPLYWQQLHGKDALAAGLLLIPQGVGTLLSRSWGGRATDTIGPRFVGVVGFSVVALATVPFAFADANTSPLWLMFALLVRGMGLGVLVAPIMSVAYIGLAKDKMPDASIITRVAQQFGGSIGTAILAVVLEAATRHSNTLVDVAHGFKHAFWWAVVFTAAAAVLSLLLPRAGAPIGGGAPAATVAAD
jgi:EmrB/QacA subfamily drug resistance transporter